MDSKDRFEYEPETPYFSLSKVTGEFSHYFWNGVPVPIPDYIRETNIENIGGNESGRCAAAVLGWGSGFIKDASIVEKSNKNSSLLFTGSMKDFINNTQVIKEVGSYDARKKIWGAEGIVIKEQTDDGGWNMLEKDITKNGKNNFYLVLLAPQVFKGNVGHALGIREMINENKRTVEYQVFDPNDAKYYTYQNPGDAVNALKYKARRYYIEKYNFMKVYGYERYQNSKVYNVLNNLIQLKKEKYEDENYFFSFMKPVLKGVSSLFFEEKKQLSLTQQLGNEKADKLLEEASQMLRDDRSIQRRKSDLFISNVNDYAGKLYSDWKKNNLYANLSVEILKEIISKAKENELKKKKEEKQDNKIEKTQSLVSIGLSRPLTEQIPNSITRDAVRKDLRDACHNNDSMMKEVDRKVGEYFGKEIAFGKKSTLSDIQGIITKTAKELEEQGVAKKETVKEKPAVSSEGETSKLEM